MKQTYLLLLAFLCLCLSGVGQVNINTTTPLSQAFAIGTNASAALPSGWKADKLSAVRSLGTYATAAATTDLAGGTNLSSTAGNGIYNFGATSASTDRAIGWLSSSSATKSGNLYVSIKNSGTISITSFTISYNIEKYRKGTNPAGFSIQMYYSNNGTTWTSAGSSFLTSFSADADNNGYASAPGATSSVSSQTLTVSLPANEVLYLAWNYSVTSGTTTSNAQALGIDDVSIQAVGSQPLADEPNNHVTEFLASTTSPSSILSIWNNNNGAVPATGYLILVNTNNTFAEPVDGQIINDDTNLSDGSGAKNVPAISSSYTWTELPSETTYYFKIYPCNGTGTSINYKTDGTVPEANATTLAPNSALSDIIENASFSYPQNIDYTQHAETDIANSSLEVASFTIRDGGTIEDADALSTILNSISFTVNNSGNLNKIAIYDGNTELSEVTAAATTTFSGLNLEAPDGGTKTFSLRASFKTIVIDNQQINFSVSGTITNPLGSTFVTNDAGGAQSSVLNDDNRIEVTATKIAFLQQPSNVAVGASMTPHVKVKADDNNLNLDLDFTGIITLTASGANLTGTSISVEALNGVSTFSTLTFTNPGTGVTLTAESGSFPLVISTTFNVVILPLPGEIVINQFSPDYGGASDEYIELVNKTNKTFELSLLKIEYQSASGTSGGSTGGTLSGTIGPYQYWLLSPNESVIGITHDGLFVAGFSSSAGQIALKVISDNTIIDGLAYGVITKNNLGEGSPFGTIPTDGGIVRSLDGTDSNNNSSDFVAVSNANIYLRNHNSINASSNYTLPSTSYPADVVVSNSAAINLSGNTTITGKLKIVSGSITVNDQQSLTVGTVTNSNNTGIIIKSTANGTGSFITNSSNVNTTIERYIPGGWEEANTGWHQISSPVADQALNAFEATGGYDFYGWDESLNTWMNYKDAGFATWNGSSNFNIGQGYLVSYDAANSTKLFTGTINVADVPKSDFSKANDGWNLLGNPYSSALKWNDGNWALNNVAGVAKVWNETDMSYSDIAENGIIPTAQGFMVQVSSATNSLTIPAAARVHNNATIYKSTDAVEKFVLAGYPVNGNGSQESTIVLNPQATDGFDFEYDSRFLAGYAPVFAAKVGNELLSTNALPSVSTGSAFPYTFVKTAASNFAIEMKEQPVGYTVYLTDVKLNREHNLTANGVYEFTAAEGDAADRFMLHFSPLAINEPGSGNSIKVYSYMGSVYVSGAAEGSMVKVSSLTGQTLLSTTTGGNVTTLNAAGLPKGIYMVTVNASSGSLTRKIVL